MTLKSIYFAHPIRTYATEEALNVLKALAEAYPDYKIVDPEDFDPPSLWRSCRQCMDERMASVFFPAIAKCEKFAIWAPVATCGIECELHKAWELGKELIYVSYFAGEVDFEDMTLQDYHYAEAMTEVR